MANTCVVVLERRCSVFHFTCLALIGCFLTTLGGSINNANGTKIVLHLIHAASVLPPSLHRPNITISDVTNHAKTSSYFQSESDDIRGPLIPDKKVSIFLVNISVGEPPVPQLLAMDTGSSLTLVQRQRPVCPGCIHPTYDISYQDGSRSTGIMALDKFTFMTSTGGISELPDLLFGLALDSHGTLGSLSGILGLQILNRHSLVSRVGKKFSYCIGNISDPHYAYNQLVLGEGAIIEGYSTPLSIRQGHYVVSLEGISVGENQLQINQQEFESNVVIDSGTTSTMLQRSAFELLKEEVIELLDGLLQPVSAGDHLCYRGNLARDLKGFPAVTLHLAGGADVSLDVEGVFRRADDDVFCMAFEVSKNDMNIIGIIAQQNYNVGFDLDAMRVSFLSIECELLED